MQKGHRKNVQEVHRKHVQEKYAESARKTRTGKYTKSTWKKVQKKRVEKSV